MVTRGFSYFGPHSIIYGKVCSIDYCFFRMFICYATLGEKKFKFYAGLHMKLLGLVRSYWHHGRTYFVCVKTGNPDCLASSFKFRSIEARHSSIMIGIESLRI